MNILIARIEAEERMFGEHTLRKREDGKYQEYIDYLLSLPEIKEPVFKKDKRINLVC